MKKEMDCKALTKKAMNQRAIDRKAIDQKASDRKASDHKASEVRESDSASCERDHVAMVAAQCSLCNNCSVAMWPHLSVKI